MATTLAHRGICVSNIERAHSFYADALGFSATNQGLSDASVLGELTGSAQPALTTTRVRNAAGVTLELIRFDEPKALGAPVRRPLNRYGLTHFCFWTPSIEDSATLIAQCGGTPHWHTFVDFEPMNTRVMYCTDPDGVRIELGERPGQPLAFLHSGICTRDPGRSADFYERVLEFRQIEKFDLREHATWLGPLMELPDVLLSVRVLAGADGERVELLQCHQPPPFGSPGTGRPNCLGLSHMTFSVSDLTSSKAQLQGLCVPWEPFGDSCLVCMDPDGAIVVLQEHAS